MKRTLGTRIYTFQELMNRLDMEYWRVRHDGRNNFTFVSHRSRG